MAQEDIIDHEATDKKRELIRHISIMEIYFRHGAFLYLLTH